MTRLDRADRCCGAGRPAPRRGGAAERPCARVMRTAPPRRPYGTPPARFQRSASRASSSSSVSACTRAATRSPPSERPAPTRAPRPTPPSRASRARPGLGQVDDGASGRRPGRAGDRPVRRRRRRRRRRVRVGAGRCRAGTSSPIERPGAAGERAEQAVAVERRGVLGEDGGDAAGHPALGDRQELDEVDAARTVRRRAPLRAARDHGRTILSGCPASPDSSDPWEVLLRRTRPDVVRGGAGRAAVGPAGDDRAVGPRSGRLAADELNAAGGMAGRPVELVGVDSGRAPEMVAAEAAALHRRGGRWTCLVGFHTSDVHRAVEGPLPARSPVRLTPPHEGGAPASRCACGSASRRRAARRGAGLAGARTGGPGGGCCSAPTTCGRRRCTARRSGCWPG